MRAIKTLEPLVDHLGEACEESGHTPSSELVSILRAYTPTIFMSTLSLEQGFNTLRAAERLLPQKWSTAPEQLQRLQAKHLEKRFRNDAKVGEPRSSVLNRGCRCHVCVVLLCLAQPILRADRDMFGLSCDTRVHGLAQTL